MSTDNPDGTCEVPQTPDQIIRGLTATIKRLTEERNFYRDQTVRIPDIVLMQAADVLRTEADMLATFIDKRTLESSHYRVAIAVRMEIARLRNHADTLVASLPQTLPVKTC